jgi:hypothetical protein
MVYMCNTAMVAKHIYSKKNIVLCFSKIKRKGGDDHMRRKDKDYGEPRDDEVSRGRGKQYNHYNKMEPGYIGNEKYREPTDEIQNLWDPDSEYNEWDIDNDDDDRLK